MDIRLAAALFFAMPLAAFAQKPNFTPVTGFDVNKYLGTWYEIARFPHHFEKNMSHVTATYTLRKDGKVDVLNRGIRNGKEKIARGRAKFAQDKTIAYFKVTFFWPFSADYKVVALDENYTYALVVSNNFDYLWILSREKTMDDSTFTYLRNTAADIGFDVSRLQIVEFLSEAMPPALPNTFAKKKLAE